MLQLELESAIRLKNEEKEVTDNQSGKILMVTSPTLDRSNSLVVSNLAISIAQTGKRVLIVNVNFGNNLNYPIFNLLKVNESKGLANYIMGDLKIEDVIIGTNLQICT